MRKAAPRGGGISVDGQLNCMVRCLSGYELVRLNIALRQRHNEEPAQLILFLLLLLIPIFLDHHPEQEQEKETEKEKDLFGYAIVLQTKPAGAVLLPPVFSEPYEAETTLGAIPSCYGISR